VQHGFIIRKKKKKKLSLTGVYWSERKRGDAQAEGKKQKKRARRKGDRPVDFRGGYPLTNCKGERGKGKTAAENKRKTGPGKKPQVVKKRKKFGRQKKVKSGLAEKRRGGRGGGCPPTHLEKKRLLTGDKDRSGTP